MTMKKNRYYEEDMKILAELTDITKAFPKKTKQGFKRLYVGHLYKTKKVMGVLIEFNHKKGTSTIRDRDGTLHQINPKGLEIVIGY